VHVGHGFAVQLGCIDLEGQGAATRALQQQYWLVIIFAFCCRSERLRARR
jgi:hypothetical protein